MRLETSQLIELVVELVVGLRLSVRSHEPLGWIPISDDFPITSTTRASGCSGRGPRRLHIHAFSLYLLAQPLAERVFENQVEVLDMSIVGAVDDDRVLR